MIYSSIILACILVAGSQASYKHKKGEYLFSGAAVESQTKKNKGHISVDCIVHTLYGSGVRGAGIEKW